MSCGQELSTFPGCPRSAEGVGCWDRRLPETSSGCKDLSVGLALPSLAVTNSSEVSVSLTRVQCTPVLRCLRCLCISNPLIGFLVPYTQSSSSLPSPLNLHIILPPCSSHCLLLFFLPDLSLLPFSLSLAPHVLFLHCEPAPSSSFQ